MVRGVVVKNMELKDVIRQQQCQIEELVQLIKSKTHVSTTVHQVALAVQAAQQGQPEPIMVKPELLFAQPVHQEPSVAQPVHQEPLVAQPVQPEPLVAKLTPVPDYLERFVVHNEPIAVHQEPVLAQPVHSKPVVAKLIPVPDYLEHFVVHKEPIVDPSVDDDSLTESELIKFVNSDYDALPDTLASSQIPCSPVAKEQLMSSSENRSARIEPQNYENQHQIVVSAEISQPWSHRGESNGLLTRNPDQSNPPLPDILHNANRGGGAGGFKDSYGQIVGVLNA